jgi:hypothetical protein
MPSETPSQTPPSSKKRPRSRVVAVARKIASWLGFLVGLGVVFAMVQKAGPQAIADACRAAGFGLVWVLLVPTVSTLLHVVGWRALIPPEHRSSLWSDFLRYEAAQAWNEVGFSLLGEPLKVWGVDDAHRSEALGSLLLDNLAQFLTTLTFVVLGVVYLTPLVVASAGAAGPASELLGGSSITLPHAGYFFVGLLAVLGAGLVAHRLGARLPKSLRASVAAAVAHARRAPRELLASYGLHLLAKSWMIVEFAVALAVVSGVHELATPVSAAPALAFASTLGSLIGAPVPGQVGAVEGSVAAIGHVLGLSLSTVVAVLLLRRLRTMLRVLVGLLLARRLVAKQPNWLLPQALASGEVFAGVDDR